jgi:predicted dehydrogenase
MRGGLIGCGFFAQNHLNAWRDMAGEGVDLAAVCDVDREKAEAAAEKFGVARVYTDAADMFAAERLDFVDIVTRMESHSDLVGLAAARGVSTIVQKPLAPAWPDAVRIVETAEAAGVRIAVHENFRFQAPMRKLKALVDSDAIGRPSWARIAFRTGFDVYRAQPYFRQEKRLALLDVGIHVLDLARFFLGEVERISCETQRRSPLNLGEDTATMLLRHESGAVSVLECTYEARLDPDPFPETTVAIEGDLGSVSVGPGYRAHVARAGKTEDLDFGAAVLSWADKPWHVVQQSVLASQRAIVDAWRSGKDNETSGRDNLKTFSLVEAAYEAAVSGRAVAPARPNEERRQ